MKSDHKGLHSWAKRNVTVKRSPLLPSRLDDPARHGCFLADTPTEGARRQCSRPAGPGVADALLLLSYPLHPPRKPAQLRTAHWPDVSVPCLFVHGTRDPFGSIDELREAMSLLPGGSSLMECEGAGHDLRSKRGEPFDQLAARIVGEFARFAGL